ncbi:MAG: hypothetical protein WCN88_02940 [Candidatus Falkowbacteria bacterium]
MEHKSPFNFFRDQYKNPDLYPPDPVEQREIKEMIKKENAELDSKNIPRRELETSEVYGPTGEAYKKTVNIIKQAGLKPEFINNIAEGEIIEKRKATIINYLSRILEDAKNYLSQVNYLQIQKAADYEDFEKYQEVVGESDQLRRSFHNKLIQDIKIAHRLINTNFNADFPEEMRLSEEAKMADRQGLKSEELKELMNERQYYNFPFSAGIFFNLSQTPKDPQVEREYYGHWALQIYSDLSALENEIRNDIKK